jgi:hypothetical protein
MVLRLGPLGWMLSCLIGWLCEISIHKTVNCHFLAWANVFLRALLLLLISGGAKNTKYIHFFFNEPHWLTDPSPEFLKHWALSKLKAHWFFLLACLCSLYLWKFNCGQSIWDKSVVLLETYWEEFGNLEGTPCKVDGKTVGTNWAKQIPLPKPPSPPHSGLGDLSLTKQNKTNYLAS